MRSHAPELPVGIVFRRFQELDQEEARLLLATADSSWCAKEVGGDWTWFGLWDLAAASGTGLLATAAAHPVEPGAMELCAYALLGDQRSPAVGDRLVREVANHLRADGVDRLVSRPADRRVRELLRRAGFRPVRPTHTDEAGLSDARMSLEL